MAGDDPAQLGTPRSDAFVKLPDVYLDGPTGMDGSGYAVFAHSAIRTQGRLANLSHEHSRTDEYVNGAFRGESTTVNLANVRRWGGYGPIKRAINQFGIDLVAGRVNSCPHLRGRGVDQVHAALDRLWIMDCSHLLTTSDPGASSQVCTSLSEWLPRFGEPESGGAA